jgi:hypothetical protein
VPTVKAFPSSKKKLENEEQPNPTSDKVSGRRFMQEVEHEVGRGVDRQGILLAV